MNPRRDAWRMAGLADGALDHPGWWLLAAAGGVVPLALGWLAGHSFHQPLMALWLFVLLLAAVRRDRVRRGMGALAVGFGCHCVAAIALAAVDPQGAAACMPDGQGYLEAQVVWITTGTDPEYDWWNWVPAHLHLVLAMVGLAVVSMALIPLAEGVYRVDLMNFYVGNLLTRSNSPLIALVLGWHPWSVIRGLCYVVLLYEVASMSLQWITGRPLSAPADRRRRWLAAGLLWAADGGVKLALLDPVRSGLAANLSG